VQLQTRFVARSGLAFGVEAELAGDNAPDLAAIAVHQRAGRHAGKDLDAETLGLLALTQLVALSERARKGIYALAAGMTLVGILAMRWNVVIGGQLFSKSFLGYTTYKMGFATREGLLPAILVMLLPLAVLWGLTRLFPPMDDAAEPPPPAA